MNGAKYEIIVEYIHKKIEEGQLKPGDKMPSENALKARFGLSRETVRHAMATLENEGIISRVRGSGTYIKKRRVEASNRIAVVTTYVDSYIFPKIIKGIEEVLTENGYVMQLSFTNNRFDRERQVLEDIIEKDDVAGIIMEPAMSALPSPNLDLYERIINRGVSLIFINSAVKGTDIPCICLDDENAGYVTTKYLISKGHKNIGALLKMDDGQGHLRFSGFRRAMREAGLPVKDETILWYDTVDGSDFYKLSDRMMDRFSECSAVLCYNDLAGQHLTQIMLDKGLSVPDDLSIIGIDDSVTAIISPVQLTSYLHPADDLGKLAAKSILTLLTNPNAIVSYKFKTKIVERDSVKENE
ncbi:MAG: GntR family transcriptional regulator [Lachnospiraceae bacterium]|nr:GntR family transcriptional regulator [Lachnospiraceae bacterium]